MGGISFFLDLLIQRNVSCLLSGITDQEEKNQYMKSCKEEASSNILT